MLKVTLKGLAAHKTRLVATVLAVVLGVGFMSGSMVLGDTVGRSFDDLFEDAFEGTDAFARSTAEIDAGLAGEQRARIDGGIADRLAAVDGVRAAEGVIEGFVRLVGRDGEVLGDAGFGAPTLAGNWPGVEDFNAFELVEGRSPSAPGEVVIDRKSAQDGSLGPGDSTTVLTKQGPFPVRVVGVATFGGADSPGGTNYVLFTFADAQDQLAEPGQVDGIKVAAGPGLSQVELAARLDAALDAEGAAEAVEVVTGAAVTEENRSDLQDALQFITLIPLVFALIALVVGSFIISNTFSIIVAQRTREMALLRAVGARRAQILRSVLLEASIIGTVAAAAGVLVGMGLAQVLKIALEAVGVDLPTTALVVGARTVIVSALVGSVVTVLAALVPALKASRVAPVAAMRGVAVEPVGSSRLRVVCGLVVAGTGVAAVLVAVLGDGSRVVTTAGAGVFGIFTGMIVLGPVLALPISRVLGAPLPRLRGVAGRLARENAIRNPRRTAATATALMIGVGVVGFFTVFAASSKASVAASIDRAFSGDLVVDSGQFGPGMGFSPALAAALNEQPEVEVATGFRATLMSIDGDDTPVVVLDPATFPALLDLDVTAGSIEALGAAGLAVHEDKAEANGWGVGSEVTVRFAETGAATFVVEAVFSRSDVAGDYAIGFPAFEANVADHLDLQVYIALVDGVDVAEGKAAVERVTEAYPNAEVQDRTEFKRSFESQINGLLAFVYVLLALAVLIALIGIANTLALSTHERTRELGLLRAVGMTRGQLRTSVRWEAVIIAVLGTLLGLGLGLFFGWAMVEALESKGVDRFAVPAGQLALVVVIAGFAGIVAALRPASRAARLDVLAAIASE